MAQAPFLEPSFTDTYATCEYVKSGVKPGPTLRLVTQTHHGGYPMVVWTWAPNRRALTIEGQPKKACHYPPL